VATEEVSLMHSRFMSLLGALLLGAVVIGCGRSRAPQDPPGPRDVTLNVPGMT
jgi:hypothetical protein